MTCRSVQDWSVHYPNVTPHGRVQMIKPFRMLHHTCSPNKKCNNGAWIFLLCFVSFQYMQKRSRGNIAVAFLHFFVEFAWSYFKKKTYIQCNSTYGLVSCFFFFCINYKSDLCTPKQKDRASNAPGSRTSSVVDL